MNKLNSVEMLLHENKNRENEMKCKKVNVDETKRNHSVLALKLQILIS